MKNIIYILLLLTCIAGCIEALTCNSISEFVYGSILMFIAPIIFLTISSSKTK